MKFYAVLTSCLALLLAAPIAAQDDPPAAGVAGSEIVVTGNAQRPGAAQVHQQARDISVTGNIFSTPIARWEDHLCPGIIGLSVDFAELMVGRIRQQADTLGIPLASGDCRANLLVIFADDGQQLLSELMQSQYWRFETLSPAERRALLAHPGPVHVWSHVEVRSRDGAPMAHRRTLTDPPRVTMWQAQSRIHVPTRRDIVSVMLVFNRAAVRGKSIDQLADYVVMRGLARTRPPEDGADAAMDTILTLFDESAAPPPGLTEFDQAYLAAIYDWIPNLPAAARLGAVNRQLRLLAADAED